MPDPPTELSTLRAEIDRCDERIADAVAERVALAEDVADAKRRHDRSLVDEERERAVEDHYARCFEDRGLDADHGRALASLLIDAALDRERDRVD